jgi:hypothetical protein
MAHNGEVSSAAAGVEELEKELNRITPYFAARLAGNPAASESGSLVCR